MGEKRGEIRDFQFNRQITAIDLYRAPAPSLTAPARIRAEKRKATEQKPFPMDAAAPARRAEKKQIPSAS